MTSKEHVPNPFGATKAVDLDNTQIQALWVDVLNIGEELSQFAHPSTAMPSLVLGAKGSGKTHLMRYHSFDLQLLRYGKDAPDVEVHKGIEKDGYIGIYVLCGSINSSRFKGKGQSDEKWRDVFAYYLELWLTHHLLRVVERLHLGENKEREFCELACELFDRQPWPAPKSVNELSKGIADLQKELDYAVNNSIMTGTLNVEILVTRGKLIFGLPKVLASICEFLSSARFVYSIDEFENLTIEQQQVVNSLIRDKEIPATFRIGARLYGVKTQRTDGAEEENLKDSEYETIPLDRIFRNHKTNYATFARELVAKRLAAARYTAAAAGTLSPSDWKGVFETVDDRWDSKYFRDIAGDSGFKERAHFRSFRAKLSEVGGDELGQLVGLLSATEYPILEKLNLLRFYKHARRRVDYFDIAQRINRECRAFVRTPSDRSQYATALDHYKTDLIAQLHRENGAKQLYLGLDNFILMSAGLPRALLTILRSIFDWSAFNGERPLAGEPVSVDAQYRGVRDASDWFFENMRKASGDGRRIQVATDRLAQLFRANRFADRPADVSMCAFAVPEGAGSQEALEVLRLCEERSFLVRLSARERKDKNTGAPQSVYQISPMLAPRWDLPLGRRGVPVFSREEVDAVFGSSDEGFRTVLESWRDRMKFVSGAGNDESENPQPSLI